MTHTGNGFIDIGRIVGSSTVARSTVMKAVDILPGYRWNPKARRYISNQTGRFVGRARIVSLLDSSVSDGERRMSDLVRLVHEGKISPVTWLQMSMDVIKTLHLQNSALGSGGWEQMSPRARGRIGGKLAADYRRLARFAEDIQEGRSSLPQSLNRANMYVGNARTEYYESRREDAIPSSGDMMLLERRVLGQAEHCSDCIALYEQGWQPAGMLPFPGDGSTQCLTNDRCDLLEREVPIADSGDWIGTKR
jgi:hypothetical protein